MLQFRKKLCHISLRYLNRNSQCCNVIPIQEIVCQRFINTTSSHQVSHSKWVMPYLKERKRINDKLLEKGLIPVDRRSQYIEWNLNAELYAFGKRLGEDFDKTLLMAALVDRSHILHSQKQQEKLGLDEIVPSVVSDSESNETLAVEGRQYALEVCEAFVRQAWPSVPMEGIRSVVDYLSSDELLGAVGQGIGLKELVFAEPYPPSPSVLATATCAVISALKHSSGAARANAFVVDFVATRLSGKTLWDLWEVSEPFALLQDVMARNCIEVEPRLVHQTGRNTLEASYQVAVYDQQEKTFLGTGYGESLEVATNEAARDALARLFGVTGSQAALPFTPSLPPPQGNIPHTHSDLSPFEPHSSNPPLETWSLENKDPRNDNIVVC